MTRKVWTLIVALAVALLAAACDDTWRGVKKDTQENSEIARQKAEEAKLDEAAARAAAKAKEAAEAAKRGIQDVARDIADGNEHRPATADQAPPAPVAENDVERNVGKAQARLEETGREIASNVRGAGTHVNVKQALAGEKAIDSSKINVDIDEPGRIVFLRGTVPNLEQKAAAERVAVAASKGYTVRNELVIAPAS